MLARGLIAGDHGDQKDASCQEGGCNPENGQLEMPGSGQIERQDAGQVNPEKIRELRPIMLRCAAQQRLEQKQHRHHKEEPSTGALRRR